MNKANEKCHCSFCEFSCFDMMMMMICKGPKSVNQIIENKNQDEQEG